jgi:hypothetical protein
MGRMTLMRISLPIALSIIIASSAIGQQDDNKNSDASFPISFNPSLLFETYGGASKPTGYLLDTSLNRLNFGRESIKISQFQQWYKSQGQLMRGESSGFVTVKIDPSALNGLLTAEGEMAYSPVDEFYGQQGFREYRPQMYRINLGGQWLGFEYGAKYLSVDEDFEKLQGVKLDMENDKAGREVWLSRSIGVFKIKTFLSDYWDNVDFNPNRPRTRKTEGGAALDIALPSLPLISLSYSRGSSSTSRRPDGADPTSESVQSFYGYIFYGRSKWDVSVSTGYYLSQDKLQSDSKGEIFYSELTASYRPTDSIIISPGIGFTSETYKWLGGGAEYTTPTASLSLSYYPEDKPFGFSTYAYYSRYKGNDGYTDASTLNGSGEMTWKLGKTILGDHSISLTFGYYHYLDAVYSTGSYKDFSVQVAYKVATF